MKEQLLELIFPPRCAVCTEVLDMEERRGILCHDCAEQLPYVPKGICPHCGGVTETAGFCDFCLKEFALKAPAPLFRTKRYEGQFICSNMTAERKLAMA